MNRFINLIEYFHSLILEATKHRKYPLTILCILLPLGGCASQADPKQAELREEASAFCEVHNPDNWKDETSSDGYEHMYKLAQEIRKVVKSDEFLQIFKDQGSLSPEMYAEKYGNDYIYFKSKITEMLGEEWDCGYLRYHYVIEFD